MAPPAEFLQPRATGEGLHLVEPDPAWPQLFDVEAARIRNALAHLPVGIHHVGSTSVPLLAAKPRIDILLLVQDPADEAGYVVPLERAGYLFAVREPDWHEHRLFTRAQPTVNLHVFAQDSVEATRMLAFRDRLRASPPDRLLYERTKRELTGRSWALVQDYADAKSAVVEEVLSRSGSGPA